MSIDLKPRLNQTAFAFRGYNVTNLGRSPELLEHSAYGPTVERFLQQAANVCCDVMGRRVDLVARVRERRETDLQSYGEAVALIMAMELAQLELLHEFHGVDYRQASMLYGYSLGEISAGAAAGMFKMEGPLRVLLMLAEDAVALSENVTMGILFSRGPMLSFEEVQRQCLHVNSEGNGVIGISSYLSPNSVLVLGQRDTVDRFNARLKDVLPYRIYLRKNHEKWPPLHTPIVWERNIPNRSAMMMHTIEGGFTAPQPQILSMVTGAMEYNDYNAREILCKWVDHPQRVWDVVYGTLVRDIETVIHVGPEPNLIPATFERLRVDVEGQTRGSVRMRALSRIVRRPWLSSLLPSRAALLRAPLLEQVILEDWLLEHSELDV